jgi:hypothetical protein
MATKPHTEHGSNKNFAVAYCDTIGCLIPYPLPINFWGEIIALTGCRFKPGKPRWCCRRRSKQGLEWVFCQPIRVHQPTEELTAYPDPITWKVCRFDTSIDLIYGTTQQAMQAASTISFHLIQKHHGNRKANQFENTAYSSRPTHFSKGGLKVVTPRNGVIYGDQPSKKTGQPCCHIEPRNLTAKACRRYAINKPSDIWKLDPFQVLKRETKLVDLDAEKWARDRIRSTKTISSTRHQVIWD